jgi:hypothetical protein
MLVAAHPGEVVDVAGLGQADHRVDQEVGLDHLGRPLGEFLMGPVHGVAGLEGDHPRPAPLLELAAQVGGLVAQLAEVVLGGAGDAAQAAAEIDRMGLVEQVVDPWMSLVDGAEHRLRLAPAIRFVDRGDRHHRNEETLGVAQPDGIARLQRAGELRGHIQRHGNRPQRAVGEAHVLPDLLVVLLTEEALKRREAAAEQELEVAELPLAQIPGGVPRGFPVQSGGLVVRQIEDLERSAVRLHQSHYGSIRLGCFRRPASSEADGDQADCASDQPVPYTATPRTRMRLPSRSAWTQVLTPVRQRRTAPAATAIRAA